MRILFQQNLTHDPVKRFSRGKELVRFLQLYLNPRVKYFIFDWSDPKPFLVDSWCALKKTFGN